MLQEAVLVEGIMATRAQIDFLWQFFVTAHIAIFAHASHDRAQRRKLRGSFQRQERIAPGQESPGPAGVIGKAM